MNSERSELERRAKVHAALSDPARLAIVDALTVGDASPGELQALVQMSSNLLAHHLRVLEAQGLLRRHRSEADRRRSYVSLNPGALSGLLPGAAISAQRVVFVCTANSARSQLAAALWSQSSAVPVASAGTHPADQIDAGALDAAQRHGVPLIQRQPQRLSDVLQPQDLLITVCDNAHEQLHPRDGLHWSIPDPVLVGTNAAFDGAVTSLSQRIAPWLPTSSPHRRSHDRPRLPPRRSER